MISCKHCTTHNSLDSTFCKRCGTAIPADEIQAGKEKLDALIQEGVHAFNEGRTGEATAIADTAVQNDPSSPQALSLRAMCHERAGELAEAVECYERVVALNPDAAIDRLKLNQVRNALATRPLTEGPDRRVAIIGAAAAVVLVLSIGILVAKVNQGAGRPAPVAMVQEPRYEEPLASGFVAPTAPEVVAPEAPVVSAPQNLPPDTVGAIGTRVESPPAPAAAPARSGAPASGRQPWLPPASGMALPRVEDGVGEMTIRPVTPNVSGVIGGTTPSSGGSGRPAIVDPDPQPAAPPSATREEENPGIIEINVTSGNRQLPGGSQSVGANGLEALVRVARDQFQLGNYAAAASSYERALKMGGDPATINQRLGQAYERLGRTGDAINAYNRAAAAYEAALNSGRGSRDRNQAGLDSSRQALRVLQGG
jgi:tetratricopeptide (TPR) repeat protein